jgi:hypothetical protein
MNKIIKAALISKFPVSVNVLMDIIAATPNPEIATEMLLGIYEEPLVFENPCDEFLSRKEANVKFLSYNKWTNSVHYEYTPRKSKYGYYLKSLPQSERYANCFDNDRDTIIKQLNLTEEQFNELYVSGYTYGELTNGTRTSDTYLDNWNGNQIKL